MYSNYEIYIVMILRTLPTALHPLEIWLLFMTKTSRVEKSALERLTLLSRDLMVTSGEPLIEVKLKQGDSLNSDVQYNVLTTWRSVGEMMSRKRQYLPGGQSLTQLLVVWQLNNRGPTA